MPALFFGCEGVGETIFLPVGKNDIGLWPTILPLRGNDIHAWRHERGGGGYALSD